MHSVDFEDAVAAVLRRDQRFAADAYRFLHGVLTESVKQDTGEPGSEGRHVGGRELLEAFRVEVRKHFGPMAMTVLEEWGLSRCEDIGDMVFSLITAGAFGKSEHDRPEDFARGFDFKEAFVQPYLPARRRGSTAGSRRSRS